MMKMMMMTNPTHPPSPTTTDTSYSCYTTTSLRITAAEQIQKNLRNVTCNNLSETLPSQTAPVEFTHKFLLRRTRDFIKLALVANTDRHRLQIDNYLSSMTVGVEYGGLVLPHYLYSFCYCFSPYSKREMNPSNPSPLLEIDCNQMNLRMVSFDGEQILVVSSTLHLHIQIQSNRSS